MCLGNIEGLCVKKLEAENPIHENVFEEHPQLAEKQRICKYECNGYNALCHLYQKITYQDMTSLTSSTTYS